MCELQVAGRGELPLKVLDDVEGDAADGRDDGHLPDEVRRLEERRICQRQQQRQRHTHGAAKHVTQPSSHVRQPRY